MSIVENVKSEFEKYDFLSGKKLLLSVSGGVDSMLMLKVVAEIFKGKESYIKVIHFDHQVREDSFKDYILVKKFCDENNIISKCIKLDFENESNFENQARELRRKFLEQERQEFGAEVVLTGHNADDVVETILHKFLKGTFLKGFSGIKQYSGNYFRPLINYHKSEIYALAEELGVLFNEDSTNAKSVHDRNFIRNELIPIVSERYAGFESQLLQKKDFYSELDEYLVLQVKKFTDKNCKKYLGEFDFFEVGKWLKMPNFMQFMLLQEVCGVELSVSNFNEFVKFLSSAQSGKKFLFENFEIEKSFGYLIFVAIDFDFNRFINKENNSEVALSGDDFYEAKIPVFMRKFLKYCKKENLEKYSILKF